MKANKPFEEVQVSDTAIWRWVREGDLYVSRMTQESMKQFKRDVEQGRKELAKPEQWGDSAISDPVFLNAQRDINGAIRQLAQPEQEPYCWVQSKLNQGLFYKEKPRRIHTIPLFTASPPKREWVGLTDDEIKNILDCGRGEFIAIQKAQQLLKDKNTTN